MFQIKDINVVLDQQTILSHIHYTQQTTGKIIGILGPNGGGKSTLIKSILGFLPHDGDAYFNDKVIRDHKIMCSYVPQKATIDLTFPITVEQVIISGAYCGKLRRAHHNIKDKVTRLLTQFELTAFKNRTLDTLSGGQLQRVLLARSLIQDKTIYFLDEPFVGIDFKSYEIIKKCLFELRDSSKLIFIVHHDLHTAKTLFDEVILLNQTIIASGKTATTLTQDNLAQTFISTGGVAHV